MLRLVRLEPYSKRRPHQLSGGQRQRVALARSLAKHPRLLLLDEPLGALDKKLREHTQFELVNIQEQLGTTFIMVTHDQEEAMTMSTRIAVMDEGRILQIGSPSTIYEYPRHPLRRRLHRLGEPVRRSVISEEGGLVFVHCDEVGATMAIAHGEPLIAGTPGFGGAPPREDDRHRHQARERRQRAARRGLGNRLPWRRLDLLRGFAEQDTGARPTHQSRPPHQLAAHLGAGSLLTWEPENGVVLQT